MMIVLQYVCALTLWYTLNSQCYMSVSLKKKKKKELLPVGKMPFKDGGPGVPNAVGQDRPCLCSARTWGRSPAQHRGLKDPASQQLWLRSQLQLRSHPWPGNSIYFGAAKKGGKKKRWGTRRSKELSMLLPCHLQFLQLFPSRSPSLPARICAQDFFPCLPSAARQALPLHPFIFFLCKSQHGDTVFFSWMCLERWSAMPWREAMGGGTQGPGTRPHWSRREHVGPMRHGSHDSVTLGRFLG